MPFDVVIDERPADILVPRLEALAREAIAARGRFAIALPGGSVATSCFPRFAELAIEWSKVHFFWGDERAVPPEHTDSNYGVANELWLSRIASPVVHRMEADASDLDAAARRYEEKLRTYGPLDLALLGMGPDGHVCSLFPGHELLDETARLVMPIADSPKPPPRRLTLTLPALAETDNVIVVATGAGKADAVNELRTMPKSRLPAALALRNSKFGLLVTDRAGSGER